jgi:hypothetical protein
VMRKMTFHKMMAAANNPRQEFLCLSGRVLYIDSGNNKRILYLLDIGFMTTVDAGGGDAA